MVVHLWVVICFQSIIFDILKTTDYVQLIVVQYLMFAIRK